MQGYGAGSFYIEEARAGADLQEIAELALANAPDDLRSLVDLGIILRDQQDYVLADRTFRHILQRDAYYDFAHFELAMSLMLQGDHIHAALQLSLLVSYRPDDVRSRLLLARVLSALGVTNEARLHLAFAKRLDPSDQQIEVITEFCDFISSFPKNYSLYLCKKVEASAQYLQVGAVLSAIESALNSKTPFSMIRLGDGEGAFLEVSNDDERRYSTLYDFNRTDRSNVWFNGEISWRDSGFGAVARKIRHISSNADILGIPYANRVEHEFRILSVPGAPSITNILRSIQACDAAAFYCTHDIHFDLHFAGLLNLIAGCNSIGLVSCQSILRDIFEQKFGIDVEFLKLPGEKGMAHALTSEALEGVHFPEVFDRTMSALSRPHNGKLFLIAGGLLGKFYCDAVKRFGGVAIDIGSLADLWVGANTRPGFDTGKFAIV